MDGVTHVNGWIQVLSLTLKHHFLPCEQVHTSLPHPLLMSLNQHTILQTLHPRVTLTYKLDQLWFSLLC